MSYGQTKVSEYFSKRKNCDGFQPSKLRKVMVDEDPGASAVTTFPTPPIGSRTRARVSKVAHTIASPAEPRKKSTRSRKCKVGVKPANQQTLQFTLIKAQEKVESIKVNAKLSEAIPTAVCDNHNASPPGSPTKRLIHRGQDELQQVSKKRGRRQDAIRKDLFQEEVKEGFSFKKVEIKEDRPVLSPRRLSSDGDDSSPVFEFRGKEKAAMKEAKLKELVKDFTAASDNISKVKTSSSLLQEGECSRKQVKGVEKPVMPLEELKQKAALSMKNPASLKAKLSKCTNLNELKEKLKQLQPASPQKKVQQPVSVQSPVKSHLTEAVREAVAKSSSPNKVRKPAYEKFAALQEPIPPGLTLPKAYKLLLDMFVGMDTVVSILHKRAEVCTFSKLKAAIQQMTRRNFELKHLGQIKTVYPTAYNFKQEKYLPCYGKKKTSECQLTVEANLLDDPLVKDNSVPALTKDGRPDFTTTRIVERKTTFQRKLIEIVHKYHKVFLSSLKPPVSIPEHKVTHWHPKFCVENVPEIEVAELPQGENVAVITSAKDALEHVKKFSNNARIKEALEKVAAENERNDAQNRIVNRGVDKNKKDQTDVKVGSSKLNTNIPSRSEEKQALKGVSQSFLEKIRAKEARKQQEAMLRSPADERRQERMSRLPELVRILRTLFVTSKKPAMLKADVLEKLADSYKACMGEVEAECHLDLLTELVPDWISILKLKRGVFISLDKNKDINAVIASLNKMRKDMP